MDTVTYLIIFISFTIHSYLCMLLVKRILFKERFHSVLRYFICTLNGLLSPLLIELLGKNNILAYTIISIVIVFEVILLFSDNKLSLIGIAFGILIHFFTCRSIVIGSHALATGNSMYTLLTTQDLLIINTLLAIWIHIVVLILFITLVSPKEAKKIVASKTLNHYICYLMISLGLFLIYNGEIFLLRPQSKDLAIQQILLPLLLLGLFYFMLVFMLKLVMLDTYQKVIETLEQKIDKDQMLSNALFNYADIVIEFNCTQDKIMHFIVNRKEIFFDHNLRFSDFLDKRVKDILHEDHLELLEILSPRNLIAEFSQGKYEFSLEYLAQSVSLNSNPDGDLIHSSDYLWHKIQIISRLVPETGEIISICTIDEINDEKSSELELLTKSEQDALTGAYNKETIKEKVSAHLSELTCGSLFVFDIDNFKNINDNMGHTFGDEVLREIFAKVLTLFRSGDLIGRFGGDEFVAFIHNDISIEELSKIAQRICDTLEHTYTSPAGLEVTISVSLGIATAPKDGTTYDALFLSADLALYASKHKGKNNFTIYNENLKDFRS